MILDAPDHEGPPELDSTMKNTLAFVAHLGMVRKLIEATEREPRYLERRHKSEDDPATRVVSRITMRLNDLPDGVQC